MRIKQTSVLARGLADAAERFYADHSRWPVVSKGDGNPGDLETDTSAGTEFIKVLLGCEDPRMALNQTRIDYLDGLKPTKPNPERENEWVNGLVMEGGTFALMDYWGRPFRVRLDADGDGEILKPDAVGTGKDKLKTRRRVAVWSAGPDGNFETWEDNPRSWE